MAWDFDGEGIVVSVFYPLSHSDDMISQLKKRDGSREYYVLTHKDDGFYYVTMYSLSRDLVHGTKEYLIPISMAYLERVGTVTEFVEPVEMFYADTGNKIVRSTSKYRVLSEYIEAITGEFIFIDYPKDLSQLVGHTGKTAGDYLECINTGTVPARKGDQ